ncbi:hypothetical protein NPIL_692851, partial [Nephila pilipes]
MEAEFPQQELRDTIPFPTPPIHPNHSSIQNRTLPLALAFEQHFLKASKRNYNEIPCARGEFYRGFGKWIWQQTITN